MSSEQVEVYLNFLGGSGPTQLTDVGKRERLLFCVSRSTFSITLLRLCSSIHFEIVTVEPCFSSCFKVTGNWSTINGKGL